MSVCSASGMVTDSLSASAESNRHSYTRVECSENSAKFTPPPSQLPPRGSGVPGHTLIVRVCTTALFIPNGAPLADRGVLKGVLHGTEEHDCGSERRPQDGPRGR